MDQSALNAFPLDFVRELPPFNPTGTLPAGDYAPTKSEFEARFILVGDIARRMAIFDGWNRHREALLTAGVPASGHQLLDGSFTTEKPAPQDIDIAVEVPIQSISEIPGHPARQLLEGPRTKFQYHCDAYPIFSLPTSDPYFKKCTEEPTLYWSKWFGTSRDGKAKGRVWATTGGLR